MKTKAKSGQITTSGKAVSRIGIALNKDVYNAGRVLAEQDQRSFSSLVAVLITREAERQKEQAV